MNDQPGTGAEAVPKAEAERALGTGSTGVGPEAKKKDNKEPASQKWIGS